MQNPSQKYRISAIFLLPKQLNQAFFLKKNKLLFLIFRNYLVYLLIDFLLEI